MLDYRLGRLKGEFVAVWYEGGKRHRWRLGVATATEARAALRDFIRERNRLTRPQERLTVAELWVAYVVDRQAEGKTSIGRMADAWKALRPEFGNLHPSDISAAVVRGYVAGRRHSAGDGTIHTELGYLRASLRSAHKHGLIPAAPGITLPPKPRPQTRFLTAEEARRLIGAAVSPHVRLFIFLALFTAGRPSSILDLTWDRVDLERRRIQLDNPAKSRTSKGRATVPITQALMPELAVARDAATTAHVIEWAGKAVRSIKKSIARAAERANLAEVSPYVLRHTAAVWMAQAGVPMSEIAQFMGHTSTSVTERVYARFSPEHLRQAADSISTVLFGSTEPGPMIGKRTK